MIVDKCGGCTQQILWCKGRECYHCTRVWELHPADTLRVWELHPADTLGFVFCLTQDIAVQRYARRWQYGRYLPSAYSSSISSEHRVSLSRLWLFPDHRSPPKLHQCWQMDVGRKSHHAFFGFLIATSSMTATWPFQKCTELRHEILATMKHRRGQASPIAYTSILGKLWSASRIALRGVYFTWSIHFERSVPTPAPIDPHLCVP